MLKNRNWFITYETIIIHDISNGSVFLDWNNVFWADIQNLRKKQTYDEFIRNFSRKALDKLS